MVDFDDDDNGDNDYDQDKNEQDGPNSEDETLEGLDNELLKETLDAEVRHSSLD